MADFTKLKAGDMISIEGKLFTARDRAHVFLLENDFPRIRNSIIYHCGPIVRGNEVVAAGPTTSGRFNVYTPKLIDKYGIRAIIGKGGMDKNVLESLRGRAVYFSAIGGAALLYTRNMKIRNLYKPEFGMAEAIYELEVRDFPVMVTMDSKGNNLHEEILRKSERVRGEII
jgi:tartrate/fumarate subfamily iron-sulfur-dependent hydro-lyase beta chain